MGESKTIAFHTLGCKLNFSETSTLGRLAADAGFKKVDISEAADVFVINTCSVTDDADKKCRYFVRKVLRQNSDAFVAVVGCYAQLKPKEISEIEGVDVVLGAAEKFQLMDHLKDLSKNDKGVFACSDVEQANSFVGSYSLGDRTRAFLKVQDGCDYNCSFCTIPLARGSSRSDSIENIVNSARELALKGVKEIVLTGVNIGDFGKGQQGGKKSTEQFYDLIQALDKVEGIERFRISSIEPNLLRDEIIEFVAQSKRFMPHFHIPLQSGSNKLLSLMRRRYKRELYQERVAKIKSLMPHCCIGVDVIVGFPGESEDDFKETYQFINELDVSYLHVFTYSERDNTLAKEMPDVVPIHERKTRNKMLRILSDKKKRFFYEQQLNSNRDILFEGKEDDGVRFGFTDNYVKIELAAAEVSSNEIYQATLQTISPALTVSVNEIKKKQSVDVSLLK